MRSLTVPFVAPEKLESAVRELLLQFGRWRGAAVTPPVPVEDIVEKYLGLTFEFDDLEKRLGVPDVLGAAWFDEKIIRVDESLLDKEGRLSFTIGHETGHWCLHRPLYEANKVAPSLFASTEPEPAVICRTSERKERAELQADDFASRLLMPTRFVRETFYAVVGSEPVVIAGLEDRPTERTAAAHWKDLAATIIEHGKFSNVSNEAMRYRLKDLGLVASKAAVVRSLFPR